jgi:ssDNA-binding replication factor A large subunit
MSLVKIRDIKDGMRGLVLVGTIKSVGDTRSVTTRYGPATVATATLEDETGSIRLNLWRDQIARAKVGDNVRLENAFVRVFNGQNELNIGKDGKIIPLS